MRISAVEIEIPLAGSVKVTNDTLHVDLSDGRTIAVRVPRYSRLVHATPDERNESQFIAQGRGMHRESTDEDLRVEGLLAEKSPGESQSSFEQWLGSRAIRRTTATRKCGARRQPRRWIAFELLMPEQSDRNTQWRQG
ncbi:MAG: DUF2442 domain-containing protein [Betaproteobacteria bacterium]|nr:DUF2442 domain-containing protein [Betaproteobacteria bacterium]